MNLSLHLEPRRKSYYSGRRCTLLKNCINWQSSSNESKSLLSYCFSGISELSLDSFRLISTRRLGVAAQWLWSSQALSAQLNCLFSFALWNPAKLCVLSFIIFSSFDFAFTYCLENVITGCLGLSGQRKRTKGWYAVCTVNIIGAVFKSVEMWLLLETVTKMKKERYECCSHSSKTNIVCVTLWHVSEISAGFSAS